ncbi:MAG: sulfurtransferase TusA family protein [Gaiellaceae bacterium]
MAETHQEDQTVDARGQLCPMPVVKTAKAMKELAPGQLLKLLATDQGARTDIPAWAETTGNVLVEQHEEDGVLVFLLRKSED